MTPRPQVFAILAFMTSLESHIKIYFMMEPKAT